jgi:hypothetical protein
MLFLWIDIGTALAYHIELKLIREQLVVSEIRECVAPLD